MQRTKKRRGPGRPPARERAEPGITLIKKYGNRRLYDTLRSRYVTLEEVIEVVAAGEEIKVVDAKTGEDLTKRIMTKLIFLEEDRKRLTLLPLSFLRKLIQYRDESVRELYQRYLALSLEAFRSSQRHLGQQIESLAPRSVPGAPPPVADEIAELKSRIDKLEELIRR